MTGFLASVSSVAEAELVLPLGADVIDLKNPALGALGAVDTGLAQSITAMTGNRALLSAAVGDLPVYAGELEATVDRMHSTGVDIIKVGVFDGALSRFILNAFDRLAGRNISVVLVFFAEFFTGDVHFPSLARAGVRGVMLDTAKKTNGNLREKLDDRFLEGFVTKAGRSGLITGLAGSLSDADIPPLLRLRPDYLGFRGALCRENRRNMQIDRARVAAIRQLIPRRESGAGNGAASGGGHLPEMG